MDWNQAVEEMLRDKIVRRVSNKWKKTLSEGKIYTGLGAIQLAYAWTHEETAVRVFIESDSGHFIVPDVEDMQATDWEIVNPKDGDEVVECGIDPQTF